MDVIESKELLDKREEEEKHIRFNKAWWQNQLNGSSPSMVTNWNDIVRKIIDMCVCYSSVNYKVFSWITSILLNQPQSIDATINFTLRNKIVFYYCQTSVLFLYNGGIFSGYQSLLALYLSGTPLWRPVLTPLAAYTLTTFYTYFLNCKVILFKIIHLFDPQSCCIRVLFLGT